MECKGRLLASGEFVPDREVSALIRFMGIVYGVGHWRIRFRWYDVESIQDSMPSEEADKIAGCAAYAKNVESALCCSIHINADHPETNHNWERVVVEIMAQLPFVTLFGEMQRTRNYFIECGDIANADIAYAFDRLQLLTQQAFQQMGRVVGHALMFDYFEELEKAVQDEEDEEE